MSPFAKQLCCHVAFLLAVAAATQCGSDSCSETTEVDDETSLLQHGKIVTHASQHFNNDVKAAHDVTHKSTHKKAAHKAHKMATHKSTHKTDDAGPPGVAEQALLNKFPAAVGAVPQQQQFPVLQPQLQQQQILQPQLQPLAPVQLASLGSTAQQQMLTGATATATAQQMPLGMPMMGAGMMAGYGAGMMAPPVDFHYNQVTVASQVSPGGGSEDPKKAAARAAQTEEIAERAVEDAIWKAQQQERASIWAAKKSSALQAASERAATAENTAARSQILAADALENDAVRRAATTRTHARVAAYKSIVQQATAYQAAADQTMAAQRAAASRAAMQTAQDGLHSMQEDTEAYDYQFNDRDARKGQRHRYHDALDEINFDRKRFRDEDEDEDYEMDEDEDVYGHGMPPGGMPRARMPFAGGAMGVAAFAGGRPSRYNHFGGRGAPRSLAHCGGFACQAPLTLLPNPATLMCGIEGCSPTRCCSAAMGVVGFASGGSQACAVDALVDATYAGDGRQYRAKIASKNGDNTYTVNWLDGFTDGNIIPGASIFMNGNPCVPVALLSLGSEPSNQEDDTSRLYKIRAMPHIQANQL